jgi:uncharacterized protein (DUF433 family)
MVDRPLSGSYKSLVWDSSPKFPKGIKRRSAKHPCTPETSAHIGSVRTAMKTKRAGRTSKSRPPNNGVVGTGRIELGEYIVADPLICHGKPTFKGTRIMVWQILEDLSRGEAIDQIVAAWDGRVCKAAVLETIRLARNAFLDANGRLHRQFTGQLAA